MNNSTPEAMIADATFHSSARTNAIFYTKRDPIAFQRGHIQVGSGETSRVGQKLYCSRHAFESSKEPPGVTLWRAGCLEIRSVGDDQVGREEPILISEASRII